MKEFLLIQFQYQNLLAKDLPTIVEIHADKQSAVNRKFELLVEAWSQMLSEGIKNDSFSYYKNQIEKEGIDFSNMSSINEIQELVDFIENGTVLDPYVGKTKLKALQLIEIIELDSILSGTSNIRFIIKENWLYDTGECYANYPNNAYGIPLYVTNQKDIAEKEIQALEVKAFTEKVLGKYAKMNIETSRYWNKPVLFEVEKIDVIEKILRNMGIDLQHPKSYGELQEIKGQLQSKASANFVNLLSMERHQLHSENW